MTVLSSLAIVVADGAPASAAVLQATPLGRVLVVTANLVERDWPDVTRDGDMRIFVDRLVDQVPYAPDALLLQEVRGRSARRVAELLSNRTGFRYVVAVSPGKKPYWQDPYRTYIKWNAILLNADTMNKLSPGGFVNLTYDRSDATAKVKVKKQAYVLAGEEGGGLRVSLASLHFAKRSELKSDYLDNYYRKQWSKQIADMLENKYPRTAPEHVSVMGGDFNSGRCDRSSGSCNTRPFWETMTGPNYRYRDFIFELKEAEGVDFVFGRGGAHAAGYDSNYNPKSAEGDPTRFYSDHQFRWGMIGSDVFAPDAPSGLDASSGNVDIALRWDVPNDPGDSSVVKYEIWRTGKGDEFRRVGESSDTSWVDRDTYRNITYRYYIVAYDGAHNVSPRSGTIEITATG